MWAQDRMRALERERLEAVRLLSEWTDNQTPSPIYIDEFCSTGEKQGPTHRRRYIQASKLEIEHAGVQCSILLSRKDDSQREYGIQIQYSKVDRITGRVAMVPTSFQTIELCLLSSPTK